MSKLIKIALVVVIAAGFGSLALTVKLAGTKKAQKAEIAKLSDNLTTISDKLGRSEKNLQQASTALGQTQGTLDRTSAELQATRVTLGQRDQEFQAAKAQLADYEKIVADAKQKVVAAEEKVAAQSKVLQEAGAEDGGALEPLRTKLEAQASENKILAAKLEQLTAENVQLKQQTIPVVISPNAAVPPNLRGKVAVVDPRWNFVVFDLGERDQVKAGSDFMIYRGDRLIGKLQVVTVGATTSVGQLLPEFERSEPRPGDGVIH
jgi:ABC-type transporter Mla subunit MlaD